MFLTVPDKGAGDVVTETMWDTYIKDNQNKGVNRPLGDTLLDAPAASVVFSSIAADWRHLVLEIAARSDRAATVDAIAVRFNGDSGANYSYGFIDLAAEVVTGADAKGTTNLPVAWCPGALLSLANYQGSATLRIPEYTGGKPKMLSALNGANHDTGTENNHRIRVFHGYWSDTAAITSITIFSFNGANFVAGSRFTLYVLGGI